MTKVGIIAGSGRPPIILAQALEKAGITPYIVALDGIAEPELYLSRFHLVTQVGMAGKMLQWLKDNQVKDVVMTGALQRPEFRRLKADPRGMRILAKILLKKSIGDDALLRVLRTELESDGLRLRGIQEYVPELLAPAGILGKIQPLEQDEESIILGFRAARELGKEDKGQSVVVQQGSVIAVEDRAGTKAMMIKAGSQKSMGRGPILVKVCKPQQDKALDLPTIGSKTAETAIQEGFSGIVVEAGQTLIVDREDVISLCDRHGIFLQARVSA